MKTVRYLIFLYFLIYFSPLLFGNSTLPFSFRQAANREKLKMLQNQNIEIRGFLYRLEDRSLLLASRPNLKSCCLGAALSPHEQMVLHGLKNPPKTDQAITVRGIFKHDAIENRMELIQTELVEKTSFGFTYLLIFGGLIFSLLLIFFKIRDFSFEKTS